MNTFCLNGIVIQDTREPGVYDDGLPLFRGVGCFPPWPLEEGTSDTVDEIVHRCDYYFDRLTLDGNIVLHVIPELELIKSYILTCCSLQIPIRTLLCVTMDSYPVCQRGKELEAQSKFIGYDFACRACDFSLLAMDIFGTSFDELTHFRSCLNEYGLFSDYGELCDYISVRRDFARELASKQSSTLEADSESCVFKLYDCSDCILSMLGIDNCEPRLSASNCQGGVEARRTTEAGISEEAGRALVEAALRSGLPARGPEVHPDKPYGNVPHFHIGPVNHIRVK